MALLTNPVLPGFSPDPSLIRVDDWYYLANSSFEWHPVIPIHKSRDLKTWEFAGSLTGPDVDLDLRRLQDSGAVWAPSLSWADGTFWVTFTVVRGFGGPHKDMDTYISRASDVAGPWSAPTRVTTTGFDPSLFHHDGRHWLLNMEWDHRPNGRGSFAGINIQELNADGTATLGEPRIIHRRPELIEGPNLYFIDGRFYLMLAEGGTGQNHGIAMMRSENILGPYEPDPSGPVLTTRDDPSHELQKAGHGEIATSPDGAMYLAHLASRWTEKDGHRYSILGRETCIQRLVLTEDSWLRLKNGGWHPAVTLEGPQPEAVPGEPRERPRPAILGGSASTTSWDDTTSGATLGWPWSTLRQPPRPDWASLTARPGWLRLRGRHSTDSLDAQSLIARRLASTAATAAVTVEAEPGNYTHSAGLIFYYNTSSYIYLRTTARETGGSLDDEDMGMQKVVEVLEKDPHTGLRSHGTVTVPAGVPLRFEGSLMDSQLHFWWGVDGHPRQRIGPAFNALQLSDDHGDVLRFTGTLVGVAAQDLRDRTFTADFTDFTYDNV